jgi:hypothetical protein
MMEFRISSCILVLWPTYISAYSSTSGQFSFRLNEMKHNSSLAIIRYAICSVFFDVKLVSLCCPSDQKPSLPCKSSASREDQNPDGMTSARATRQTSYAEAYYKIFCDIGYPLHIERLITSAMFCAMVLNRKFGMSLVFQLPFSAPLISPRIWMFVNHVLELESRTPVTGIVPRSSRGCISSNVSLWLREC